jgi:Fe-S oxidoreductase
MRVLEALPGVEAAAIDAGCCGLAGSFGYEIEHREMSKAIAEDRLAPAVRACQKDTVLVASGLSCRSQIAHMTDRQSLHLAEFLAMNLR